MSTRKFTDLPPWAQKFERWTKTKGGLKLAMLACIFFGLFEVYSLIAHQVRLNESHIVPGVITDLTHARRGKMVHFEFSHNGEIYRGKTRIYRPESFFAPEVGETIEVGVLNNDGSQHISNLPGNLMNGVVHLLFFVIISVTLYFRSR